MYTAVPSIDSGMFSYWCASDSELIITHNYDFVVAFMFVQLVNKIFITESASLCCADGIVTKIVMHVYNVPVGLFHHAIGLVQSPVPDAPLLIFNLLNSIPSFMDSCLLSWARPVPCWH